ncbi:MAG: transposase [Dehalococcoidia bacterium]|nr:transposase [Dehalococcoidia bacterium]
MILHKNLPKFDDNSYAHFITTNTYKNYPFFRDEKLSQILLEELEFYSRKLAFALIGYVIMPDHLHLLLWRDREEKSELGISKIMNRIKTMTSKRAKRYLFYGGGIEYVGRLADVGQPTRVPFRLWQPSFYDFNIYNEEKLLEKLDYIHNNPVRAGLVLSPGDYEWSSYRLYFSEEPAFQRRIDVQNL